VPVASDFCGVDADELRMATDFAQALCDADDTDKPCCEVVS